MDSDRSNIGPYDFEFQHVPPAACNRCGALVQKPAIHDAWHEQALTRAALADVFTETRKRIAYGPASSAM